MLISDIFLIVFMLDCHLLFTFDGFHIKITFTISR